MGGPFTTEQVEDVKTVFRILLLYNYAISDDCFLFFLYPRIDIIIDAQ